VGEKEISNRRPLERGYEKLFGWYLHHTRLRRGTEWRNQGKRKAERSDSSEIGGDKPNHRDTTTTKKANGEGSEKSKEARDEVQTSKEHVHRIKWGRARLEGERHG